MTKEDKKTIYRTIKPYLKDPYVQEMKEYIQHGDVTTYRHSINVVKMAFLIDKKFRLGADRETLLTAALLHDCYLYDWHDKPLSDLHGYRHPHRAAQTVAGHFDVDEKVLAAIESHMWPLTLRTPPTSREAVIVCLADKLSSMAETLWMR